MKYYKKSLGQNFLIDINIAKKIINTVDITGKNILEIGPGKGALTDQIVKKKPKSLILIEKDLQLFSELKIKNKSNKKITIYNKDILKYNFESKLKKNTVIFGNLPYNISSQILVKMIKFKKWPPNYSSLIFMFQKELAERIKSCYGSSHYGRLSIISNYRLNIKDSFDVSANCFFPRPKIKSTILYFVPKKNIPYKIDKIDNLEYITNQLFSKKRKMINKSIKNIFKSNKKIDLIKNLNLNNRPSELSPEKYFEITKLFEENS